MPDILSAAIEYSHYISPIKLGVFTLLFFAWMPLVNWVFGDRKPGLEEPEEKPAALPEKQTPELTSDSLIVDKLSLSNIGVSFLKPGMEKPIEFRIDKCSGSAQPGKAFEVTLEGSTLEEPYEVSIRAASLQELLEENKSWVEIETKIAKAQLNF